MLLQGGNFQKALSFHILAVREHECNNMAVEKRKIFTFDSVLDPSFPYPNISLLVSRFQISPVQVSPAHFPIFLFYFQATNELLLIFPISPVYYPIFPQ